MSSTGFEENGKPVERPEMIAERRPVRPVLRVTMTSRERILCALKRGTPDRVPYAEVGVSGRVLEGLSGGALTAEEIGGIDEMDVRGVGSEIEISRLLRRDHVCYRLTPPVPVDKHEGAETIIFYGKGRIRSKDDLARLVLPDLDDGVIEADMRRFVAESGDYASCLVTRMGVAPTYLAMGMEDFALALYDDLPLVEAVLERYADWAARVCRLAAECGFDFIWTADDLAFKTGPLMSPEMFRKIFLPQLRRVADSISLPWVFHSDGNLTTLMSDLVNLGISGLNPIEPGAMDIAQVKKEWGRDICLLGNVDVNTLSVGTPEDVRGEVRRLLSEIAPGGGYVLTSGNSLPTYARPDNVRAMIDTLKEFGEYPI